MHFFWSYHLAATFISKDFYLLIFLESLVSFEDRSRAISFFLSFLYDCTRRIYLQILSCVYSQRKKKAVSRDHPLIDENDISWKRCRSKDANIEKFCKRNEKKKIDRKWYEMTVITRKAWMFSRFHGFNSQWMARRRRLALASHASVYVYAYMHLGKYTCFTSISRHGFSTLVTVFSFGS